MGTLLVTGMGFHCLWTSGGSATWGINFVWLSLAQLIEQPMKSGRSHRPPEVFCAVAKPKIDGLLGISKARTEAAA